jgi:hypothetical protein
MSAGVTALIGSLLMASVITPPSPAEGQNETAALHAIAVGRAGRFSRNLTEAEITGGRRFASLGELVGDSDAIVAGRVIDGPHYWEADDGRSLVGEFKLRVDRVIRGRLLRTNVVTVAEIGGNFRYADGAVVSLIPQGPFGHLTVAKNYLMFLRRRGDANGYRLVGGPQGLFELGGQNRAFPADHRPDSVLARTYRARPTERLIEDVVRMVGAQS